MKKKLFPALECGIKDIGWLKSKFTFSFSNYYNPEKNGFGLLKVFNDDLVEAGKGFGLHPHHNMEIISVMMAGKMNHKDTMGYTEIVEKDWVQIMSAGSGLRHEEYNIGNDEVNFLQIWIEPKLQNINPRYQKRYFPEVKRKNILQTIVSNEEGTEHCWINQNAKLSLGYFSENETIHYIMKPLNKSVFIYVMDGEVEIDSSKVNSKDGIGLWETGKIEIKTIKESRFIVIETPINH